MVLAVVAVVACVCSLTSCADRSEAPIRPSASSTAAKFNSEERALAAAKDLYLQYLAAVQRVSEDGSKGLNDLKPLLSDAAYAEEVRSFRKQSTLGIYTVGKTTLIKFTGQAVDAASGKVVAYACVDLRQVRVRNRAGEDVTPETRPSLQTFLPAFVMRGDRLVLQENGTWSGDSIC